MLHNFLCGAAAAVALTAATVSAVATIQLNFSVFRELCMCVFFLRAVGVDVVADDAMFLRWKSFSLRYDIVHNSIEVFGANTFNIFLCTEKFSSKLI